MTLSHTFYLKQKWTQADRMSLNQIWTLHRIRREGSDLREGRITNSNSVSLQHCRLYDPLLKAVGEVAEESRRYALYDLAVKLYVTEASLLMGQTRVSHISISNRGRISSTCDSSPINRQAGITIMLTTQTQRSCSQRSLHWCSRVCHEVTMLLIFGKMNWTVPSRSDYVTENSL